MNKYSNQDTFLENLIRWLEEGATIRATDAGKAAFDSNTKEFTNITI